MIAMVALGQEHVVGADGIADAIAKPFSMREILIYISNAVRRSRPEVDATQPIRFGAVRIDREEHRLWVAETEVELTPLEYKLLLTLHDRRDQAQSRDTLLSDVWGISAEITTRTVDTHVKRLRSKLREAADHVQTVRGIGYRFVSSPEEAQ